MSELRIGTCSWKYDSWRGLVYSDKPKINYLEEYSAEFNTVEIDQWFWSLHPNNKILLPRKEVVSEYNSSVDKNFLFSIKMPNSITLTHHYRKNKSEPLVRNEHFLSTEILKTTLNILDGMRKKLGPLMFQFEYLNREKMSSLDEFLSKLGGFLENAPREYCYGIEIRNPNYLNKKLFEFIKDQKLSFVFLQGYYMPDIYSIYEKYREYISNLAVIRLHGPDRKGIEKKTGGSWDRIVEPKDEQIKQIVEIIRDLLSREVNVFLNVNNHYEGSAPLTIKKILNLFG